MGRIISAISGDGAVLCHAIDSSDMVARAESLHKTSAVVTAALGRLMTAASLMGFRLKGESDSVTLRIRGGGPVGSLIAVADSGGNVRGYPENPVVEIPLNARGKLDVAGAVGKDGHLFVMRDTGQGEPYIGSTPIVSGEIAEDITHYYALSEQVPTVCALGVLVNPNLTVNRAGGFIAQLLPGAPENAADILEHNIQGIKPVTELLSEGKTPEDIALAVLEGLGARIISSTGAEYRCNCSRERVEKALASLGRTELLSMAEEQPITEADCHFCNKKYRFSPAELRALVDNNSGEQL